MANIIGVDGKANPMALALESLKNQYQYLIEYHVIQAKLHKNKYDCLRNEGFDEKQALELCKSVI